MDIFGNKKKQLELQKQEANTNEALKQLINRSLKGDLESGAKLTATDFSERARRLGLSERMASARAIYDLNLNFNKCSIPILNFFTEWEEHVRAGNLEAAAEAYSHLESWRNDLHEKNEPRLESELHINIEKAAQEFAAVIQSRYDELCAAAETSAKGFESLRNFINDMNRPYHPAAEVPYPDNWNTLVGTHVHKPSMYDFIGLAPYWTNETYWLYAAGEAKAKPDVILAKQVIAVYNNTHRDHVSRAMSNLVSDLVTMVATKRIRA